MFGDKHNNRKVHAEPARCATQDADSWREKRFSI